jgi:hypothetical protein
MSFFPSHTTGIDGDTAEGILSAFYREQDFDTPGEAGLASPLKVRVTGVYFRFESIFRYAF